MSFSGKVVIITGASSGIGAGAAVAFAKEGASLALTARTLSNLEKTKEDCLSLAHKGTPKPLLITADLTNENDVKRVVSETISNFGKIDVLVNNAGANKYHTIETFTLDAFDFVINTNLRAPYQLTNLVIPHLEKTHGNIVNVSSIGGVRPFTNANTYCASKAALDQFTRCSAVELGPKNIRVNVVSPGLIVTNFQNAAGMDKDAYREMMKGMKDSVPLGRAGVPEDIADAICFIASDKAKYITGAVLTVDGGKSCVTTR